MPMCKQSLWTSPYPLVNNIFNNNFFTVHLKKLQDRKKLHYICYNAAMILLQIWWYAGAHSKNAKNKGAKERAKQQENYATKREHLCQYFQTLNIDSIIKEVLDGLICLSRSHSHTERARTRKRHGTDTCILCLQLQSWYILIRFGPIGIMSTMNGIL